MIFPTVPSINNSTAVDSTVILGKAFLCDYETGQLVIKDGKPVRATYTEAIKQWVELFLRTQLNKYKVYQDTGFGMLDLYNLRGHKVVNNAYLQAEIKRELKENLEKSKFIKKVDNVTFEFVGQRMIIKLTTFLEGGEVVENEVTL